MDSRIHRVGRKDSNNNGQKEDMADAQQWYDIDFEDVIKERKKYYEETDTYHMIASDARETAWLEGLPKEHAIVIMEGISMYLKPEELVKLVADLAKHFNNMDILMDCYTTKAAKAFEIPVSYV